VEAGQRYKPTRGGTSHTTIHVKKQLRLSAKQVKTELWKQGNNRIGRATFISKCKKHSHLNSNLIPLALFHFGHSLQSSFFEFAMRKVHKSKSTNTH